MTEGERELGPREVLELALDPEADVLDRLQSMDLLEKAFEDLRISIVAEARRGRKSWDAIGEAMGKARQNVWRKYAPLVGETAVEDVPQREPLRLRLGE